MTYHQAWYSLIQFCPDRSRAEAANIGVLLFCPELGFAQAKTAHGNDRVRKFFGKGSFDAERLAIVKTALEERVAERYDWSEGLPDLERFIGTRANDILLTTPRSMKTADPVADLAELYDEVVGGRARSDRTRAPAEFQALGRGLRQPALRDRIRFKQVVSIPELGKELQVPYAYQNGVLNLVKPHLFSKSPDRARRDASELAVEGGFISKHDQRLIIVPAFARGAEDARESVDAIFAELRIRVVHGDQVDAFIEEVNVQAHE